MPTPASNAPTVSQVRTWRWLVLMALLGVAATGNWLIVSLDSLKQSRQEADHRQAEALVRRVNEHILSVNQLGKELAAGIIIPRQLPGSVATPASMQSVADNLINTHAVIRYGMIFPTGKAAINPGASPPFSFASLDAVKRSENSKSQVTEALPVDDGWLVTVATPIKERTDSLAGTLYLYFDSNVLLQGIHRPHSDPLFDQGSFDIVQTLFDNESRGIVGRRVKITESIALPLAVSHWTLRYQAGNESLPWKGVLPQLGLFVLMGCFFVLSLFKAVRQPVYTSEIRSTDTALNDLHRHAGRRAPRPAGSNTSGQPNSPPSGNPLPDHVFRANDIRGIANETITGDFAYQLGQAFASAALDQGINRLLVACDGRQSSPELTIQLTQGIRATGVEAISLGDVPTPLMYFAAWQSPVSSGVIVTGSHNPPEYNGFKMVLQKQPLYDAGINDLKRRMQQQDFHQGAGGLSSLDT
ncbi:MAG: hypothetical protein OEZ23_07910, partial [Gammaproteobacteria bacterium]|nr:hypothetical protein [Gammaproteobacteria bacterium]